MREPQCAERSELGRYVIFRFRSVELERTVPQPFAQPFRQFVRSLSRFAHHRFSPEGVFSYTKIAEDSDWCAGCGFNILEGDEIGKMLLEEALAVLLSNAGFRIVTSHVGEPACRANREALMQSA